MRTRTQGSSSTANRRGSNFLQSSVQWGPTAPEPALPAFPGQLAFNQNATARRSNLKTTVDTVTPGYFKKAKSGSPIPVNKFQVTEEYYSDQGLSLQFQASRYEKFGPGGQSNRRYDIRERFDFENWPPPAQSTTWINPPSVPTAPLLQQAVALARSELWDVGTFLAEVGKSATMVATFGHRSLLRARRISDIIRGRRRGRSRNELISEFNSMWLEARYGWRPLFHDLNDIAETVNRIGENSLRVRKYSSSTASSSSTSAWTQYGQCFEYRTVTKLEEEARAFVGASLDLSKPVSLDPFVTGWEVVPYSFVVDWFFNVGSAIQAFSPFAVGEVLWSGVSVKRSNIRTVEWRIRPDRLGSYPQVHRQTLTGSTFESVRKERTAAAPSLDLRFKPNLSALKIVDLVALASQLRTSRSRSYR